MKNLYRALANFTQEVPVILKDTTGYGYQYADLPAIFKVINPLMAKHGLGFTQLVNGTQINTKVFHIESGETIESNTDIPQGVQLKGMNDFQVLGSAITYIRRYALSSILGLVTDKDTDGAGEQVKTPQKAVKQQIEGKEEVPFVTNPETEYEAEPEIVYCEKCSKALTDNELKYIKSGEPVICYPCKKGLK